MKTVRNPQNVVLYILSPKISLILFKMIIFRMWQGQGCFKGKLDTQTRVQGISMVSQQ